MRPASVDDLRQTRDFDLRAFIIGVLLGTAATIAIWAEWRTPHDVGPTAATLDDAGRVLVCIFAMLAIGPGVALVISRRGGHLWTPLAVIPTVLLLCLLVFVVR